MINTYVVVVDVVSNTSSLLLSVEETGSDEVVVLQEWRQRGYASERWAKPYVVVVTGGGGML